MDTPCFQGRVAVVTGSSRGIGRAIAEAFSAAGADVVVNHRDPSPKATARADAVCARIRALGRRAIAVRADIADRQAVHQLIAETNREFGRLDFLVLNAARAPFKPIERLLERELRQLVETNFLGHLFCLREALPLLETNGGKVVFISSLGSRVSTPSYPLGSMKAAMEAVVRDCADSLGERGIRVNAVCGGIARTDSFKVLRQVWDGLKEVPDRLFVEPEEIADVVLFLCSPAARGIRGQTLVVDRGLGNRGPV